MNRASGMRGNVMFMILIGVALFAALSWAITRNWAGISSTSTQERARLFAVEASAFGDGLRPVIDRMALLGSVADAEFSFASGDANAAYGVPGTAPANEIFHSSGGKLKYLEAPAEACTSACAYEFTGQIKVTGVGDDTLYELAMVLPGVTQTFCEAANKTLNSSWTSVPTGGALTLTRFAGLYGDTAAANPITLTGAGNIFVGKRAFCYQESAGANRYIYVHVLRAR